MQSCLCWLVGLMPVDLETLKAYNWNIFGESERYSIKHRLIHLKEICAKCNSVSRACHPRPSQRAFPRLHLRSCLISIRGLTLASANAVACIWSMWTAFSISWLELNSSQPNNRGRNRPCIDNLVVRSVGPVKVENNGLVRIQTGSSAFLAPPLIFRKAIAMYGPMTGMFAAKPATVVKKSPKSTNNPYASMRNPTNAHRSRIRAIPTRNAAVPLSFCLRPKNRKVLRKPMMMVRPMRKSIFLLR